jgi:hypothetical protein
MLLEYSLSKAGGQMRTSCHDFLWYDSTWIWTFFLLVCYVLLFRGFRTVNSNWIRVPHRTTPFAELFSQRTIQIMVFWSWLIFFSCIFPCPSCAMSICSIGCVHKLHVRKDKIRMYFLIEAPDTSCSRWISLSVYSTIWYSSKYCPNT